MKLRVLAMSAVLALGVTATTEAAFIATIPGSDCAGVFGQSFDDCKIPTTYDPNNTPVIIKFNATGTSFEVNSLFGSVDGSEFAFVFGAGGSGSFTYTPGPGDPLITFYVAKGGDFFNLFSMDDLTAPQTGAWFTPTNPANSQPFGLSHLTFYDAAGDGGSDSQTPEPATMALFGLGLALAASRLRKRTQ